MLLMMAGCSPSASGSSSADAAKIDTGADVGVGIADSVVASADVVKGDIAAADTFIDEPELPTYEPDTASADVDGGVSPECLSDDDCPVVGCRTQQCTAGGSCNTVAPLPLGASCTTACGVGTCDTTEECRPSACDDGKPCTLDRCGVSDTCENRVGAGFCGCSKAQDCETGESCIASACLLGACVHTSDLKACPITMGGESCDNYDPCMLWLQKGEYHCAAIPVFVCHGPCTSAAACADTDPCTQEVCSQKFCVSSKIAGCDVPCTVAGTCNDGDPCTKDECTNGSCVQSKIPGCSAK